MTSHTMGACCVSGFKHEGESVGETKTINGIATYISAAPDKSTDNAILYLCDAFGHELVNNRLLADDFARAGYLVVVPDLFHGDPVPERILTEGFGNFDLMGWVGKHPAAGVDKVVESTIKHMRGELGVKKIGAVGYCFGGKYVVRFLAEGKGLDAGFIAHPSFVEADEVSSITKPLSIAAAETDGIFPAEKRRESEDILQKIDATYQLSLYSDVEHGFAVRTDLKERRKKFAKESAYIQAARFFDEYVKKD